jgi:hypothetical protein
VQEGRTNGSGEEPSLTNEHLSPRTLRVSFCRVSRDFAGNRTILSVDPWPPVVADVTDATSG